MWRISWRSKTTGVEGHGTYCLSKELAQAWLDHSYAKWRAELSHWSEQRDG